MSRCQPGSDVPGEIQLHHSESAYSIGRISAITADLEVFRGVQLDAIRDLKLATCMKSGSSSGECNNVLLDALAACDTYGIPCDYTAFVEEYGDPTKISELTKTLQEKYNWKMGDLLPKLPSSESKTFGAKADKTLPEIKASITETPIVNETTGSEYLDQFIKKSKPVGINSECVSLVKFFDPSLGVTSTWAKGEAVLGNNSIEPDTQ